MRHEKIGGITHIYVEKGETEQMVLSAIVKASFELARPAGMGWMHFNKKQQMTDEEAIKFITLTPRYIDDKTVVNMDYVQGRKCKTYISRIEKEHFTLENNSYERDRGVPDSMLNRAKEIIGTVSGNTFMQVTDIVDTEFPSTVHTYKGENLTLRLKEYGFTRMNSESDWNFRKRIFPDMFSKDVARAMEFLIGGSVAEWDGTDKLLYLVLLDKGNKPDRHALVKFANGFHCDPLERKENQRRLAVFAK